MWTVAGMMQIGLHLIVGFIRMGMTRVAAISAGFGLEGGFAFAHCATQTFDHLGQNVICLEAQLATVCRGQNLYRHMAVAEVVGGAGKKERVIGDGLDQLFLKR